MAVGGQLVGEVSKVLNTILCIVLLIFQPPAT